MAERTIARVHSVHVMNIARRQVAADLWIKAAVYIAIMSISPCHLLEKFEQNF